MAILHSWCCWRSVRKGSFACGIYTAFYFTITAVHCSKLLHEQLKYWKNCRTRESFENNHCSEYQRVTFLDLDQVSQSSVTFTIVTLSISACGILASCLLLYGLFKDCRVFLIPWIIVIVIFTLNDVVYIIHQFVEHALGPNPVLAIIITVDLFIISLNIYALLCVISQYQELKEGRGRASDDQNNRVPVPNIHYSSQPTATSYLSTRRTMTYQDTRPTPTQSPTGTGPHTSLAAEETSPSVYKGPRKSVKFPDRSSPTQNGPQLLEPWTIDVKSPSKGIDTTPLIETSSDTLLQSNL